MWNIYFYIRLFQGKKYSDGNYNNMTKFNMFSFPSIFHVMEDEGDMPNPLLT